MSRRNFLMPVFALGFFLILNTNCAARTVYVVKSPPSPKVVVVKTPAPYTNAVWVKGHWAWRNGRYVWIDGYWVKPKRGHIWVQGHWVKRHHGWVWVKGRWKRVR